MLHYLMKLVCKGFKLRDDIRLQRRWTKNDSSQQRRKTNNDKRPKWSLSHTRAIAQSGK